MNSLRQRLRERRRSLPLLVLIGMALAASAQAASPSRFWVASITNDYIITSSLTAISTTNDPIRVGSHTASPAGGRNAVFIFPLPRLGSLSNITSVEVAFTMGTTVGTPAFSGDLWAIGIQTNTSPLIEYCEGNTDPGDPTNMKLHDNLLVAPTTSGRVVISTNPPLRTLVQNFYDSHPDYISGHYLFLRLNPDSAPGTANAWNISTGDGAAPPILTVFAQNNNPPSVTNARPNFVILISDDQRHDSLGVVQREQAGSGRFPWFANGTPGLDRLAAAGVRFRNAYVVQSVCSPSRAAMLTGVYNHVNGIENNFTRFPIGGVSYASLLRESGYRTGVMGKYHMTGQMMERPGFDEAVSFIGQGDYTNLTYYSNGFGQTITGWVDDLTTDRALSFLDANRTNSFALVVGFKSPHSDFTPPTRNASLYATEVAGGAPSSNSLAPYKPTAGYIPDATVRNYFRCIKSMDENVGRILDRLDYHNLASNTVVVFISDNGFMMSEHGFVNAKWTSYESSIRTALLVRYPPLTAARTNNNLVLNIDLMPTILDLAGVSIPTTVQGRSLAPLLVGNTPSDWRQDFLYENFRDEPSNIHPIQFALRSTTHKLILYPGHPDWTEMFHVAVDPYELTNRFSFSSDAALHDSMLARLQELLEQTGLKVNLSDSQRVGNELRLTSCGGIGPIYQVESSANLQSWSAIQQFQMTNAVVPVTATNSGAAQFIRLRMLSD